MTNTKFFLFIGTSLSLIPSLTSAQCVATQDCATLGYTETSCSGGSGIKCPFGNKWACFKSESEFCDEYGFTLSCTGANQTGGGSKACNGKYYECSCSSGYTWNDSSQKCEDATANCTIGSFYYADGTCSNDYLSNKELLGIVIYEKSVGQNGWVMTHKPVKTNIYWSTESVDISGLPNYTSESSLTDIQSSCTNTDIITAYGSSSKYPAAWAAKNYKGGGKTWCLPSGGLLKTALSNQAKFNKFKAAILKIQYNAGSNAATIPGNVYQNGDYYYEDIWSSSEYSSDSAWEFDTSTNNAFYISTNRKSFNLSGSVRPVTAF